VWGEPRYGTHDWAVAPRGNRQKNKKQRAAKMKMEEKEKEE
jgi:hypothetical protein